MFFIIDLIQVGENISVSKIVLLCLEELFSCLQLLILVFLKYWLIYTTADLPTQRLAVKLGAILWSHSLTSFFLTVSWNDWKMVETHNQINSGWNQTCIVGACRSGPAGGVQSWSSKNRMECWRRKYTMGSMGACFPGKFWNLASLKYAYGTFSEKICKKMNWNLWWILHVFSSKLIFISVQ